MTTKTKKIRLVRVMNGLYRTRTGNIRVGFMSSWRGEPAHWEVRFENWYNARVVVKFPSLAECRKYINENS